MATASRGPLSDRQIITLGALIVGGLFFLACGAGMGNAAVGGLGIAVAVLGPTLLIAIVIRGSKRDFVFGSARVIRVSARPEGDSAGRCELDLLVTAHNVHRVPAHVRAFNIPVTKWPETGTNLPVMVDVHSPNRVRILWDELDSDALHEQDPLIPGPSDDRVPDHSPVAEPIPAGESTDLPESMEGAAIPAPAMATVSTYGLADEQDALGEQPRFDSPDLDPADGFSVPEPAGDPDQEDPDTAPAAVTLHVSDLDRSRAFYRDTLGLSEIECEPFTAVLAFGETTVVLRQGTGPAALEQRALHLHFDVSDVQESYERLRERGVEFVHPPRITQRAQQLELYSATFRDPDGYELAITRWAVRQ